MPTRQNDKITQERTQTEGNTEETQKLLVTSATLIGLRFCRCLIFNYAATGQPLHIFFFSYFFLYLSLIGIFSLFCRFFNCRACGGEPKGSGSHVSTRGRSPERKAGSFVCPFACSFRYGSVQARVSFSFHLLNI